MTEKAIAIIQKFIFVFTVFLSFRSMFADCVNMGIIDEHVSVGVGALFSDDVQVEAETLKENSFENF